MNKFVIVDGGKLGKIIYNKNTGETMRFRNNIYDFISNFDVMYKEELESTPKLKSFVDKLEEQGFYEKNDENSLNKKQYTDFTVELTSRCNLKCKHCCVDAQYSSDSSSDLSFEDSKYVFDCILETNPACISLTGGEPLLVDYFEDIVKYIRTKYNKALTLSTNGTLINPKNVNFIVSNFDSIDISLDGYDELSVSELRGEKVFNKVIKTITLLKENGFDRIAISYALDIMCDENAVEKIVKFENLCKDLEVEPQLRELEKYGRGENLDIKKNYLKERKNLFYNGSVDNSIKNCTGGINEFSVNSKGEVFPCFAISDTEYKLGSVFFDKFESLDETQGYKNFKELVYPISEEKCKECSVYYFCRECPLGNYQDKKMLNVQELYELCEVKYNYYFDRFWKESHK